MVYQNVTFTGRIVQEIDGVCDSNSPIAGLEVAPNFNYSTHPAQAYGSNGLPATNSDGVWTGALIFGSSGDFGSDYESYVGTWTYNIFFGGDGTYSARSLHDQTGSFAYVTVAGPPTGTVTISSPIEIYAFDGSFNPSPTGGDCTQVGFWDAEDKQCLLTADIATSGNTAGIKIGQSIWPAGYSGEGTTQGITIKSVDSQQPATITGNGGGDMSDAGVYLYKTTFPTIHNLVIKDFKVGINSHQTSGTKIIGNTIQDATGYGIYVYDTGTCPNCGSGILINGNTVEDSGNNNGGSSIQVQGFQGDGTCNTTIPYFLNLSEVGQPPGNNPTPVTIVANTVTDAPGWGITLDAAGACVNDNTITGAHSGINVSGPGYSTSQSDNNIISNNVVSSSVNDGIVLTGSGNTIDSNTVTDSQYRSGFKFDYRTQNNIITNNVANNNNEYGF
ncbi:MAG TPA: hypothetical protein EYO31_05660, partial [Phycisphaerales bacterium]|nr:hypothetical protein [Phycisphaerales bacterium]